MRKYISATAQSARLEYDAVIDSVPSAKLRSLGPEVGKLRAVKSKSEQQLLRCASDISGLAHAKVSIFV
jgi:intermediate cleaving peptidase 55